ncbi:hypothetical protein CBZ_05960 [Cellulomonas biazotea]|uniref:Uncharacterized protein n=1 Tax=Cellulomonas biazotea TaxID=1709 RepID=A0A402DN44_9CELL|nr:hypothetical protein CBZ_05960 [Cellulomonas biazotea]
MRSWYDFLSTSPPQTVIFSVVVPPDALSASPPPELQAVSAAMLSAAMAAVPARTPIDLFVLMLSASLRSGTASPRRLPTAPSRNCGAKSNP